MNTKLSLLSLAGVIAVTVIRIKLASTSSTPTPVVIRPIATVPAATTTPTTPSRTLTPLRRLPRTPATTRTDAPTEDASSPAPVFPQNDKIDEVVATALAKREETRLRLVAEGELDESEIAEVLERFDVYTDPTRLTISVAMRGPIEQMSACYAASPMLADVAVNATLVLEPDDQLGTIVTVPALDDPDRTMSPELMSCVQTALESLELPPVSAATQVTYPIQFQAS